jgi:hypothetical protein
MFKDTCLIALKRKNQSPHIIDLETLVYLVLKSSFAQSWKSLLVNFEMILLMLNHTITQMQ